MGPKPQQEKNKNEEYDDPLFLENDFDVGVEFYFSRIQPLPSQQVSFSAINEAYLADFNSWCRFSLWSGDCQQARTELEGLNSAQKDLLLTYPFQHALALFNLADINFYLGYYQKTADLTKEGTNLLYGISMHEKRKQVLLGQLKLVEGKGIWKGGDHYMALLAYIKALSHYQQAFQGDFMEHYLTGRLICLIGQLYAELEETSLAINLVTKGIDILESHSRLHKDQLYIAAAYNILGKCHLLAGSNENLLASEQLFNQAEDMFEQALGGKPHRYRASVTGNKGLLFQVKAYKASNREWEGLDETLLLRALACFQEELVLRQAAFQQPNHPTIARAHSNIAYLQLSLQEVNQALASTQKGIIAIVEKFTSDDFRENPSIDFSKINSLPILRICLQWKAKALLERYLSTQDKEALEVAHQTLGVATQLIEQMRHKYIEANTKFAFAREIRPVFELHLEALHYMQEELAGSPITETSSTGQEKLNEAIFQVMQQCKARLLYENLAQANGTDSAKPVKGRKWKTINWRALHQNLWENMTKEVSIEEWKLFFDDLPENPSLQNPKHEIKVDIKALCGQFRGGEKGLILSYLECSKDIFVMLIGCAPQQFKLIKLGKSKRELRNLIRDLTGILNHEEEATRGIDNPNEWFLDFKLIATIGGLHKLLISPITAFLEGVKRIYIIPDEDTSFFPFELLAPMPKRIEMDERMEQIAFSQLDYLIRYFQITYYPSTSTLYETHSSNGQEVNQEATNWAIDLLSVGASGRLKNGKLVRYHDKNIDIGLDKVKDQLAPNRHVGHINKEQNQQLLVALEQSQIIHFFVHTITDDQSSGEMAIVLKGFDQRTEGIPEQSVLRQKTLQSLTIKAQLVLLNACRTGWGTIAKGEGPLSWSRTFLDAKAQNIYFTSLRIDSFSAQRMVDLFIRYLNKGETFAKALQSAKLEVINESETAHPYFWAAPVFMGSQIEKILPFNGKV